MSSTAMAKREPQAVAALDSRQLDVLKNSICRDHSDGEVSFFLEYCGARGFNPFSRMIYSTIRTNNRGVRQQTFQTGIDGMRTQAETSGKYAGQLGPFWCGDDGAWRDIWLGEDAPTAAKVGVLRNDFKEPIWAIAKWTEYKPAEDWMWRKMPSNQLAKCAEALALRKAFPEKLAGIYSEDEMAQAAPKEYKGNTYLPEGPQLPGQCCMCEKAATAKDTLALYCGDHKQHAAASGAALYTGQPDMPAESTPPRQDAPQAAQPAEPARKPRKSYQKAAAPPVPITGANFKEFLERMAKAKEAIGHDNYYRILGKRGMLHANMAKELNEQTAILLEMADCYRTLPAAQAAPPPVEDGGLSLPNYKTALVPYLNKDAAKVARIMVALGFDEGRQPATDQARALVLDRMQSEFFEG